MSRKGDKIVLTLMKDGNHLTRFKKDHWKLGKLSKGLKVLSKKTVKGVMTVVLKLTDKKKN